MLHATCPGCRARYRVPESAAGKRTTCKKCGGAFRISTNGATAVSGAEARAPAAARQSGGAGSAGGATAPGGFFDALDALADGQVLEPPRAPSVAPAAAAVGGAAPAGREAHAATAAGAARTPAVPVGPAAEDEDEPGMLAYPRYIKAVGRGFAVFTSAGNAITFLFLWLLLALRQVGLMFSVWAWVPWLIIAGWYSCFLLRTVAQAADDDSELPGIGVEDGWWDGILIPCFQMASAYVVAAAPAVIYLVILLRRISAALAENPGAVLAGGTPDPGSQSVWALVLLFALGMFIWPMLVLVVALGGGVMAMFRLDLILTTIRRALPAYLLTVVAVYVGLAMQFAVIGQVTSMAAERAAEKSDWTMMSLLPLVFVGITLFFDIATMRAIGYFYCHFKHKFAWTWG